MSVEVLKMWSSPDQKKTKQMIVVLAAHAGVFFFFFSSSETRVACMQRFRTFVSPASQITA